MKRFYVLGMTALVALCMAATWKTGEGGFKTASTNVAKVTLTTTVNTLTVKNTSSPNLFVGVNCTTNVLMASIAAGTALPITTNDTFVFDTQGNASIESFCYAVTNDTAALVYRAY